MELLLNRMKIDAQMKEDARSLPEYFWQASPDLRAIFLTTLKRQYGSTRENLRQHGAEEELFNQLEKSLMI